MIHWVTVGRLQSWTSDPVQLVPEGLVVTVTLGKPVMDCRQSQHTPQDRLHELLSLLQTDAHKTAQNISASEKRDFFMGSITQD